MNKNLTPIPPTEDVFACEFNTNPLILHEKLNSPSDKDIKNEPTFLSKNFEDALKEGGDFTKEILKNISKHLDYDQKYIFVDVKVQYLKKEQTPVQLTGCWWHVDGAINIPDKYAKRLGHHSLMDFYARKWLAANNKENPKFFSLLSNNNCSTEYIKEKLILYIAKCIPSFKILDDEINKLITNGNYVIFEQPSCQIVQFDSSSLHRAIRAKMDGWRYWIRVSECNFPPPERTVNPNKVWLIDKELY